MADTAASIQILIGNLKQLNGHHPAVISGVDDLIVKQLTDILIYFNALIEKVDEERGVWRKIRDAVYEAEDAAEAYVTQAVTAKSKIWIGRFFPEKVELDGIARRLQEVRDEIADPFGDMMEIDSHMAEIIGVELEEPPETHQIKDTGNHEDEAKLIRYLTPQIHSPSLDVISIIDRHDLGKTTLAKKVLRNPLIQYEFPTRIWVNVSEPPRNVYLNILKEFTGISERILGMADHELARRVSEYLEKGRFLLVANDVLSPKEWDKLCVALPSSNQLGKVLITSRDIRVGLHGNFASNPHEIRFLGPNESWELLRIEVLGDSNCPNELESYGRAIARKCGGHPLAIMVVGRILKSSARDTWQKVHRRLCQYDPTDGSKGMMMNRIISLSYDELPYHLKACFLYLGIFPRDFNILAWKLIHMWIAEGFIQERNSLSMEETAESYLNILINRNLLGVDKRNCEGKVKMFRVHDAIMDFCKTKAGEDGENIFQDFEKILLIQNDVAHRRLCINSEIMGFAASRPSGLRLRSLFSFSKEDITLPSEYISTIPSGFKLLRVLDFKPVKFPKLSSDMFDLIHLRYLRLSLNLSILPPSFTKFSNLQTLFVYTMHRSLLIKADIYKMKQLRHLKTNAIAVLPEPTSDVEGGGNIKSLSIISTQSCTENVIEKLRNLISINIRGPLHELLEEKTNKTRSEGSFESIAKLGALERLKLKNDMFPLPSSEGKLHHLPSTDKFPMNLRILTLSETFLEWSQMGVLGSLEKLQVLKLKEKAFMGNYWDTIGGGFPCLKVLLIGRTDLVVWKASPLSFPVLEKLDLRHCDELREIPIGLAGIQSFRTLELNHCRAAAISAKNVKEAKLTDNNTSVEFALSIFPP